MRQKIIAFGFTVAAVAFLVGAVAFASHRPQAADAQADADGPIELVFAEPGLVNATGNSTDACGLGEYGLFAVQVKTSGVAGTNPTYDFVWRTSYDGGATWTTVRTFAQVNATVTPASQLHTAAEVAAVTPVVLGDCMDVSWTVAGTGPVATVEIVGYAE
jgi:hypothetical protein